MVCYEQKVGIKGLASDILVVRLGINLKPVETLIITDFATNNQPVTWPEVVPNNWKLSLNGAGLVLKSD